MPSKQYPTRKGRSHNTVKNYVFGVKKWFDQNDIKVNWDKIEMPRRQKQWSMIGHHKRRTPHHHSSLLLFERQSMIYCNTACGLRINTLLSLRVEDVIFPILM